MGEGRSERSLALISSPVVGAGMFASIVAANADAGCVKQPGLIGGPIISSPNVAREIYLSILHGRGDKLLPRYEVEVHDDGDHWSVYQFHPPEVTTHGTFETVKVEGGGGGLEMTIAKCDGTIGAHYSK